MLIKVAKKSVFTLNAPKNVKKIQRVKLNWNFVSDSSMIINSHKESASSQWLINVSCVKIYNIKCLELKAMIYDKHMYKRIQSF